MCHPVPGPPSQVAECAEIAGPGSALPALDLPKSTASTGAGGETAATALKTGDPTRGCIGPFGERRVSRVLERARQILAAVLVELRESEANFSTQITGLRTLERGEQRTLFVIDVSRPTRDSRLEEIRLHRTRHLAAAIRRRRCERAGTRMITGALGQLGVCQMVTWIIASVDLIEMTRQRCDERRQRDEIVSVVLDHLGHGLNIAAVEIIEVKLRNQRARHIVLAVHSENLSFELDQPHRTEPLPEDTTCAVQQVEVWRQHGSWHPIQDEPCT